MFNSMTVHFAAARSAATSPVARVLSRRVTRAAANDNMRQGEDDRLLHAALRHFSEYGMSAAREARRYAEHAFFAGDRTSYDWWLGICRALDKRLAEDLERKSAAGAPPQGRRKIPVTMAPRGIPRG